MARLSCIKKLQESVIVVSSGQVDSAGSKPSLSRARRLALVQGRADGEDQATTDR
jgi:hypothetical protein